MRRTHVLAMKSPCPCLGREEIPKTWICAKPRDGVGICGSDWGAGLVCDNQLTAVATEVIAFDDFRSCALEKNLSAPGATLSLLSAFFKIYNPAQNGLENKLIYRTMTGKKQKVALPV